MKKKVYLRYMSNTNNQYIYDDASGNIFQWNNLYEEIINMYCEHNLTTITENLLGKYNIDEIQEAYKFLNYWIIMLFIEMIRIIILTKSKQKISCMT